MKTESGKLKIWETSLLVAICISLLSGLWAQAAQNRLADELVRLHVIAESDADFDQALKLRVRDAVLAYLAPRLEGAKGASDAREIIEEELGAIELVARSEARRFGSDCGVSAEIGLESYPSRDYERFALPAGDYVSLRVTLGGGAGQNWWCVVFPPLCLNAVESASEDAFGALTPESERIIKTEDGEYTLKFRIVELFENIRKAFLTKAGNDATI